MPQKLKESDQPGIYPDWDINLVDDSKKNNSCRVTAEWTKWVYEISKDRVCQHKTVCVKAKTEVQPVLQSEWEHCRKREKIRDFFQVCGMLQKCLSRMLVLRRFTLWDGNRTIGTGLVIKIMTTTTGAEGNFCRWQGTQAWRAGIGTEGGQNTEGG